MNSETKAEALPAPRKLWQRVLLMLLLAIAFQLSGWLLFATAVAQLIFVLATGEPNARLLRFGRSLGWYLGQVARFETFATEALPFPFSDWPSDRVSSDEVNGSAY
jgi:hypothetical protein